LYENKPSGNPCASERFSAEKTEQKNLAGSQNNFENEVPTYTTSKKEFIYLGEGGRQLT
jgi:hypothetical protein